MPSKSIALSWPLAPHTVTVAVPASVTKVSLPCGAFMPATLTNGATWLGVTGDRAVWFGPAATTAAAGGGEPPPEQPARNATAAAQDSVRMGSVLLVVFITLRARSRIDGDTIRSY